MPPTYERPSSSASNSSTFSNRSELLDFDTDPLRKRLGMPPARRHQPLTKDEINDILNSREYTGYTYGDSRSYRRDGSLDYTFPNFSTSKRVDFGDGGDVTHYQAVTPSLPRLKRNQRNQLYNLGVEAFSLLLKAVRALLMIFVVLAGSVYFLAKKFFKWLALFTFPSFFGPIYAVRGSYSGGKRVYQSARYIHEQGYPQKIWDWTKTAVIAALSLGIWAITLGTYDLNGRRAPIYQQETADSPVRQRRNRSPRKTTPIRGHESPSKGILMRSSTPRRTPVRNVRFADQPSQPLHVVVFNQTERLRSAVKTVWGFIKAAADLLSVGIYTAFGWTLGRFIVEDGKLKRKRGHFETARAVTDGIINTVSTLAHWIWETVKAVVLAVRNIRDYAQQREKSPTRVTRSRKQPTTFNTLVEKISYLPSLTVAYAKRSAEFILNFFAVIFATISSVPSNISTWVGSKWAKNPEIRTSPRRTRSPEKAAAPVTSTPRRRSSTRLLKTPQRASIRLDEPTLSPVLPDKSRQSEPSALWKFFTSYLWLYYGGLAFSALKRLFIGGERGEPSLLSRGVVTVGSVLPKDGKSAKRSIPWILLALLLLLAGYYSYDNHYNKKRSLPTAIAEDTYPARAWIQRKAHNLYDYVPGAPTIPAIPEMSFLSFPTVAFPSIPTVRLPSIPTMSLPSFPEISVPSLPKVSLPSLPAAGSIRKYTIDPLYYAGESAYSGIAKFGSILYDALAGTLHSVGEFFVFVYDTVRDVFVALWKGVISVVTYVWNGIRDIAAFIWRQIIWAVTSVQRLAVDSASAVKNGVAGFFSASDKSIPIVHDEHPGSPVDYSTSVESENGPQYDATVDGLFTTVVESITNALSAIVNGIKSAVFAVAGGVQWILTSIWQGVLYLWNGLISVLSAIWSALTGGFGWTYTGIGNVSSATISSLGSLGEKLSSGTSAAINAVSNGIAATFSAIGSGVSSAGSGLINGVSWLFGSTFELIQTAVVGFWTFLGNVVGAVRDGLIAAASSTYNFFTGIGSTVYNAVPSAPDAATIRHYSTDKVTAAYGNAYSSVAAFFHRVADAFGAAFHSTVGMIGRSLAFVRDGLLYVWSAILSFFASIFAVVQNAAEVTKPVVVVEEKSEPLIVERHELPKPVVVEEPVVIERVVEKLPREPPKAVPAEPKVRKFVQERLDDYDADKTGIPDYALESSGGSIIGIGCTKVYEEKSRLQSLFGIPLYYSNYGPRTVIQRSSQTLTPGVCWAYVGATGTLKIKLSRRVNVTAISYEHIPIRLSPEGNINTAPKEFLVWSYQEEGTEQKHLLGSFEYTSEGAALQMFQIQFPDPKGSPIVELETTSNHGAEITCLYRFRVHGAPVKGPVRADDEL